MIRRSFTVLGCALMLTFLFAGTQAHAARVVFTSNGGSWSHGYHSGWNRYWGGPSIGFYYAPSPVYLVAGYGDPSYYEGSSFWYSNPSFGLGVNIGGGGGYGGGGYGGRSYGGGGRSYGGGGRSYSGGGGHSYSGGGGRSGGRSSGGGRSAGVQRSSGGGGHSGGGRSSGGGHGGGGHGGGRH